MKHTHTDHASTGDDSPADAFDAFDLDPVEDEFLDRQLFAIRESLADFRSL